jgi:hypothetical protein
MKKFFLSLTMLAFAVAVQAGDAKNTTNAKEQSPCCAAKTCSDTKAGCCSMADKGKTASVRVSSKDAAAKRPLLSPKAQGELGG